MYRLVHFVSSTSTRYGAEARRWGESRWNDDKLGSNLFRNVQEVLWSIRWTYSVILSFPLTNGKWHSYPWPTMTSQPIRIMSGFHGAFVTGVAYQQGTFTLPDTCTSKSQNWSRPPILGLACAPIVETRFLEVSMSLLDFSHRIPLVTFSNLLIIPHLKN